MTITYMLDDQRFASSRTDVLVYQTEPLETDLVVAGPLKATLHVSTTGTDSDWVVKLIDVYPGDFPEPPAVAGARGCAANGRLPAIGAGRAVPREVSQQL